MKIVHIGDSDSGGGAAHAMSRLHESLQRLDVESRLLVRNSSAAGNGVETIATRGDADDLYPAVRDAVVRQYVELNRTTLTNTHFSLYIDGVDLSSAPLVDASDIVHLHWTASFQTPADVRALVDTKPVVWTLHDLGPLTGGCHFPAGCERYTDGCRGCPQLVRDPFAITATTLRDKKTLWAGRRMTFIAPSRYMEELARGSAVAQQVAASIVHIPHGIDVATFCPLPKAAARRALGIPADGLYVLCGSSYNTEKRKGMHLLSGILRAADRCSELGPSKPKLLTVGDPKLDLDAPGGWDVIQLGRVSQDAMVSAYAAADIFLHPSLEDNSPCMLLESLSCGTPAIAFDVGGVADIVLDEVCGRVFAAGDGPAMGAALAELLADVEARRRMGERARAHVEQHFSDVLMARRHTELYAELLANPAPATPASRPRKAGIDEIFPRWSTACLVQELALARTQASALSEESGAKSEHLAAFERESAALTLNLADQYRQLEAKQAELTSIHEVAQERKALADELHASATRVEAFVAKLERDVRERDDVIAKLQATIGEQSAEITLVHHAAADRAALIKDLHHLAQRRTAESDEVSASVEERR